MATPTPIADLETEVSESVTVMASATALIKGFKDRLAAGIAAALTGGATAAELTALTKLKTDLDTSGNDLAAAVSENTPAAEA